MNGRPSRGADRSRTETASVTPCLMWLIAVSGCSQIVVAPGFAAQNPTELTVAARGEDVVGCIKEPRTLDDAYSRRFGVELRGLTAFSGVDKDHVELTDYPEYPVAERSLVYCDREGKGLRYYSDFVVRWGDSADGKVTLRVETVRPRIEVPTRWFDFQFRYTALSFPVARTTIEEYLLLSALARCLGVENLPAPVIPERPCAQ